jgi:hypothetical protein
VLAHNGILGWLGVIVQIHADHVEHISDFELAQKLLQLVNVQEVQLKKLFAIPLYANILALFHVVIIMHHLVKMEILFVF